MASVRIGRLLESLGRDRSAQINNRFDDLRRHDPADVVRLNIRLSDLGDPAAEGHGWLSESCSDLAVRVMRKIDAERWPRIQQSCRVGGNHAEKLLRIVDLFAWSQNHEWPMVFVVAVLIGNRNPNDSPLA